MRASRWTGFKTFRSLRNKVLNDSAPYSHRSMEVTIEIRADNPVDAEALRTALAFNGYDKLLVEDDGLVLISGVRNELPARPGREADFELVDGIEVYVEEASVDYYSSRCFARVWLDRPAVDVVLGDGMFPRADQLVYAIIPVMGRFRYYALHAGAVSDNGFGYLLMGDSGGGKSTSAVLAARAGWSFVSDDFVYLRREGDETVAIGLREEICLRDDATVHFPELIENTPAKGDSHKFRIRAKELFGDRVRSSCTPKAIVIPSVSGEPHSELEEVARSEVLAEALRQSGPFLVDPRTVPQQTSALRYLIENAACVRLKAGRDILAEPEKLTRMLAKLSTEH